MTMAPWDESGGMGRDQKESGGLGRDQEVAGGLDLTWKKQKKRMRPLRQPQKRPPGPISSDT